MKIQFNLKLINKASLLFYLLLASFSLSSCDFEYDLPEAGSKADLTPPEANFNFTQGQGPNEEWKNYNFGNLSTSATGYFWDFGDGNSSTEKDGVNTYPGEGTYVVSLTATDNLGATNTYSQTINVLEPEAPAGILPVIHEAGFEDGDTSCGTAADGRDCWRISGGAIFGITASPVRTGSQGAKFDAGSNRVAYQELTVSANTSYTITMFYTIKTSPVGSAMRLAVCDPITNASEISDAIFESTTGNDQSDANTYTALSLTFNTGARTTIGIWIDSNNISESRVDDVSIVLN